MEVPAEDRMLVVMGVRMDLMVEVMVAMVVVRSPPGRFSMMNFVVFSNYDIFGFLMSCLR